MANFTAYQDVECVYPMSGQYGRAPRALYYTLLLFVVVLRRQNWLTAGAAASCLTFGGSAAIHALILAPILSLGHPPLPDGVVSLSNFTVVAVKAVAMDLDADATLAVVGTGFLIVIPMALWSAHFRHSGAVPILVLWILLMFVRMLCCMTDLYAVNGTSTGPLRQFRFCSPAYNDTLPFSGNAASIVNNSWNDTIWSYFENDSGGGSCLYPCLSSQELLRQPGDAKVIKFLDLKPGNPIYWGLLLISAIIYGCVPLTILFAITILILRLRGHAFTGWGFESSSPRASHSSSNSNWKSKLPRATIWAVNVYGLILTPLVFVVFLVWVEWIISFDLQSEEMQLVGQWAPLVGAGLVFVAAVVGKYSAVIQKEWRAYTQEMRTVANVEIGEIDLGDDERSRSAWGQEAGYTFLQGFGVS
jgi:hypothetical protein